MWYNKIVMNNGDVKDVEKFYVNKCEMWEIDNECGIDVLGNEVIEFWSKD
jgi:hypothetical protein